MSATVSIYVEDITTQLLTYESIKLYSSTAATGTFTNLVATETLVAGTEEYSITDSSGDANTYYRYTFYHSTGPVESTQSEVFRPLGATLLTIMSEAARQANAGFTSTCTSTAGDSSTLVDTALRDQGVDTKFLEGIWIYRPDAAASGDMIRRVSDSGFTVASGIMTMVRDYTNPAAASEVYHGYSYYPPHDQAGIGYSWQRAVSDALQATWYVDYLNLGEGTTAGKKRFSLSGHIGWVRREDVRRVLLRTTDSNDIITDVDAGRNGMYWTTIEDGPGSLSVELYPPPGTSETVIVEVARQFAPLYNDTDISECPLDLAVKSTLWKMFEHLNSVQPDKYNTEEARWARERDQIYSPPLPTVIGV